MRTKPEMRNLLKTFKEREIKRTGLPEMAKIAYKSTKTSPKKAVPVIVALIIGVIGLYLLFTPGFGLTEVAVAQVDPTRIGETVTESVGESTRQETEKVSEAMSATEGPGETEGEPVDEEPQGDIADNPEPADSDQQDPLAGVEISAEGIGGKDITELTLPELYISLMKLDAVTEVNYPFFIAIMARFQQMVRPPINTENFDLAENPPWISESRRYSPFDPVGTRPPVPAMQTRPLPPFQNPEVIAGPRRPEVTAAQVASAFRITGVMGEPGNYRAILVGLNQEKTVTTGDIVAQMEDLVFIVEEITLNNVKVIKEGNSSDFGLISFGGRETHESIQEFSISY